MDLLRRRPPTSALVYFGLAAVCAVAAVTLMSSYRHHVEATRPDVGPAVSVVVAASDLVRGTVLAEPALTVQPFPSSLVPPGALTVVDEAIGRTLVADIADGEVVTRTRVGSSEAGPVAALVPPGLRAFVLRSGVPAGTLRSGDLVDVIATYGAGGGRPYTDTVATEVQVLKVLDAIEGLSASGVDAGVQVVVLADPETVETLARASALGVVTVSIAGSDEVGSPGAAMGEASPAPGYLDG
jgi:pilus assembly protein CpaB